MRRAPPLAFDLEGLAALSTAQFKNADYWQLPIGSAPFVPASALRALATQLRAVSLYGHLGVPLGRTRLELEVAARAPPRAMVWSFDDRRVRAASCDLGHEHRPLPCLDARLNPFVDLGFDPGNAASAELNAPGETAVGVEART